MTNAEKFKEVFGIEIDCGSCNPYPCDPYNCKFLDQCNYGNRHCGSWWDWEYEELTTKNDLGVDYRSLEDIKKLVECKADALDGVMLDAGGVIIGLYFAIANDLPPVTPQDQVYPLCEDCHTKMDEVRRAYDNAMKQESILDKINKMKSEIADSLEFWDYSPNNNPLARDMLETITNFWGDMREE